jgi:hypothetical protein
MIAVRKHHRVGGARLEFTVAFEAVRALDDEPTRGAFAALDPEPT